MQVGSTDYPLDHKADKAGFGLAVAIASVSFELRAEIGVDDSSSETTP
jgi:hypothetical protein